MKNLKKILFILMAVVTLVACKSDDDNNEPTFLFSNTNLAGSHDLTFLNVNAEITDDVAGIPFTVLVTGNGNTFQTTMNFMANGTFVIDGEFAIATETTADGTTTPGSIIIDLDNETGTYNIGTNANTKIGRANVRTPVTVRELE